MVDQAGHAQAWRAQRGKTARGFDVLHLLPVHVPADRGQRQGGRAPATPAERDRIGITLVSPTRRATPRRRCRRWPQAPAGCAPLEPAAPYRGRRAPSPACSASADRQLANGEFNHSSAKLILLDADGRILARSDKVGSVPDPAFVARSGARWRPPRKAADPVSSARVAAQAWFHRRRQAQPALSRKTRARVRACPRRRSGDSIPAIRRDHARGGCAWARTIPAGDLIQVSRSPRPLPAFPPRTGGRHASNSGTYNDKVVMQFTVATVFWGIVGMLVGC